MTHSGNKPAPSCHPTPGVHRTSCFQVGAGAVKQTQVAARPGQARCGRSLGRPRQGTAAALIQQKAKKGAQGSVADARRLPAAAFHTRAGTPTRHGGNGAGSHVRPCGWAPHPPASTPRVGGPPTIQVCMRFVSDEELGAVCVGPAVGHGQHAALGVLQVVHQLVWELAVGGVVNRFAAFSRACGVAALPEEVGPRDVAEARKIEKWLKGNKPESYPALAPSASCCPILGCQSGRPTTMMQCMRLPQPAI